MAEDRMREHRTSFAFSNCLGCLIASFLSLCLMCEAVIPGSSYRYFHENHLDLSAPLFCALHYAILALLLLFFSSWKDCGWGTPLLVFTIFLGCLLGSSPEILAGGVLGSTLGLFIDFLNAPWKTKPEAFAEDARLEVDGHNDIAR